MKLMYFSTKLCSMLEYYSQKVGCVRHNPSAEFVSKLGNVISTTLHAKLFSGYCVSIRKFPGHAVELSLDSWQFHRIRREWADRVWRSLVFPQRRPLGVYSFIKGHANSIHLVDGTIKVCLEVAVSSKRFTNMTCAAMFRVKLNGFEVLNVVCSVNGKLDLKARISDKQTDLNWKTCSE